MNPDIQALHHRLGAAYVELEPARNKEELGDVLHFVSPATSITGQTLVQGAADIGHQGKVPFKTHGQSTV